MISEEQQQIVTKISKAEKGLIKVSAVAGSGKTTTLVNAALAAPTKKILYMTFSKAMTEEAKTKFPSNVTCMTIHSLAYRNVYKQYSLGTISKGIKPTDIKGGYTYEEAIDIAEVIEDFCLSSYTDFAKYTKDKAEKDTKQSFAPAERHITKMANGKVACTHSFYLKLFHILLSKGKITIPSYDILMIDESQDLTQITVGVVNMLPINTKVLVGDEFQSIFGFMKCVNAFEVFKDEGEQFRLTRSFRVADTIASNVEIFIRTTIDNSFKFKGQPCVNVTVSTTAYLARTNSTLVGKMFKLWSQGVKFNLTRNPSTIFGTVLTLLSLNNGKPVQDSSMKFLEKDRKLYNTEKSVRASHSSLMSYVLKRHSKDRELKAAYALIEAYGPSNIWDIYNHAKDAYKKNGTHTITLSTLHSSKGLEWDKVVMLPDVEETIANTLIALKEFKQANKVNPGTSHEIMQEINLYYVGCTRAKFLLEGTKNI